jgi:hypothetical protein
MTIELDDVAESVAIMRACQSRISDLKEVMAQHRAVIEEKMGSEEVGTVDGDPVISWKTYKQRRLNQAILGLSYPEILELCKETTETRRMEVL